MLDPKHDPFSEQLKADIQIGIDQADRGEIVPAEQVFAELDDLICRKYREQEIMSDGCLLYR